MYNNIVRYTEPSDPTHLLIFHFEIFVSGILVSVYLHVGHVTFLLGYPLVDLDEALYNTQWKLKKKNNQRHYWSRKPQNTVQTGREIIIIIIYERTRTWFCGILAFLLRITATPMQMAATKDSAPNANTR